MKDFSKRLQQAMVQGNVSQAELVSRTGICRSGISQYLSGKVVPGQKALTRLAMALEVTEAWLMGETEKKDKVATFNLPVEKAAKLMGVGKEFVRCGLQQGVFPWGYAVNISGNRFTYFISSKMFTEYTGIVVEEDGT